MIENHMTQGNADAFPERTDAEQREHDAKVKRIARAKITNPQWWSIALEGMNEASSAAPAALARCMENLKRACDGEQIAMQAITAALSILERHAFTEAKQETEGEME